MNVFIHQKQYGEKNTNTKKLNTNYYQVKKLYTEKTQ